jgi:DNA adenine methylase
MKHYTPLRYPGGKGKVSNYIKLIFELNSIKDGIYVEPYAGGAGVALTLLLDEYVSEIYINDLNPSIHAFWLAVLDDSEELCDKILQIDVNMDQWYKQCLVQQSPDNYSSLDLAFSTFFLNRTNRSGIISKAGVIGGKDQNGRWKIDARFNKEELVKRIRLISMYRDRINLTRRDAIDLITSDLSGIENAIFYLDPPYYVAGQELYANFYKPEDHSQIADVIKNLSQPWIVSYDNVKEIRELYEGYRNIQYGLAYSAADKYIGSEIMFFSDALRIPRVDSPTGLSIEMVNMASEPSLFPLEEI